MEKRDLTEYISREMLEQLTGEAFRAPEKKRKWGELSRLTALAACVALVVIAVNFDTVYAAVRELLYFLPGSGAVTQEEIADYWLAKEEYAAHTDKGDYIVSCLYRRGDTLALRVKKDAAGLPVQGIFDPPAGETAASPERTLQGAAGEPAPESHTPLNMEVAFRDEEGNLLELETAQRNIFSVHDMTTGKGSVEVELEKEDFTLDRFTLILDGEVEFPVELYRVNPEDYILDPAFSARSHGYTMSLLPLNQNGTRFALIPVLEDESVKIPEKSYWAAQTFGLEAVGESGRVYEAETVNSRPGCQEYYIPELPEERITVIRVTSILESTRYDKAPASVKLPALALGEEVTLDEKIELWNYPLQIQAAGLTREGELWVKIEVKGRNGDRWLNQIDLEWPETAQKHTTGSTTIDDNGHTSGCTGMAERAGKKTTLPITFVSVVQHGLWEFRLPAA